MTKVIPALAAAAVVIAVAAVVIWQAGAPGSGRGDPVVETVGIEMYRGPLAPDEQPSGFVKHSQVVALVTVTDVEKPRWNTPNGTMPAELGLVATQGLFVYTPVLTRVESYIKGAGPETIRVSQIGGTRDGIEVVLSNGYKFSPGMKAVVFLNPPGMNVNGWTLENAYIISGDKAYSQWDEREMSVGGLETQLRQAAAAEAGQ